jgi:sirohydrochlorin ferrochelatase
LILSHGLGGAGDRALHDSVEASSLEEPAALAFGMSMTTSQHIQVALDELVVAGAEEIVVIPMLSTHHNSLMRQWEYIFSERDEPEYTSVERVKTPARIIMVSPLDDHPQVGAIVAAHAREVSYEPDKEEVIIVGHGPVDEADNLDQLAMMKNIAAVVQADRPYAAVHVATLQDDAPREVRMANFQKIRDRITAAAAEGRKTIIVTNLLGSRIVQSSLRRGLSGMEYRFNLKGLLMHEDFINWIEDSAIEGFASG